ncbi:hypothetical protein AB6A40_009624 [Gnathostoma spinigerum]|uniref:Uncharacterized protein n=1 Tax=Gnathostoma spinigerum TaxID=75299 RepID=A0ABD6ETQ7_9BILA
MLVLSLRSGVHLTTQFLCVTHFYLLSTVAIKSDAAKELSTYFGYNSEQLSLISDSLRRLKEVIHKKTYGNRVFSRDSAVDQTREISISSQQPSTVKKLVPYLFQGFSFLFCLYIF